MDSWLIFQHYRNSIKTDGGDADRKLGGAMVSKPGEGRSGEANPPGRLPGKASKESQVTVPQTDTGGRDEYSKALG